MCAAVIDSKKPRPAAHGGGVRGDNSTARSSIFEGRFGRMVAHNGVFVDSVPLSEATGRLRTVPLDSGFVHATRSLGICLGD